MPSTRRPCARRSTVLPPRRRAPLLAFLAAAGLALTSAPALAAPAVPVVAPAGHAARAAAVPAETPAVVPAGIDAVAARTLREARATLAAARASSMSIAVSDGSRVLWGAQVGTVDGAGTRPGPDTRYGLGSVSKVITAVAVMQLVDAGRVDLDAPVTRYLPDFRMLSPGYRTITVRMLLNHTAGLPGTDYANGITTAPYDGYQAQVLRALAGSRLKTTPGSMAVYCNDCFTLAGAVVARVSGMSYPDYVTARVLAPLGMAHTTFPMAPYAAGTWAPVVERRVPRPQEFLNIWASGGIWSTPRDMSRLATMLLRRGVWGGTRVLSAAAVAEMSRWQTASTLDPAPQPSFRYGLGWDTVAEPGLAAVGVSGWQKGGDTTDYHAAFLVAPGQRLAVTVLGAGRTLSSTGVERVAQVAMLALLAQRGSIAAYPRPLARVALPARTPSTATLRGLRGTYLAATTPIRVVSAADASLRLQRLADGSWVDAGARFTQRRDGRFWSTTAPSASLRVVRGWGRSYLVLRKAAGVGHYREDTILGQKVPSAGPLSAAWQARLGRTWLPVRELPTSILWNQRVALGFGAIPGLRGYLWAEMADVPVDPGTSDSVASMFIVVPTLSGRDQSDIAVVDRGGQEWLVSPSAVLRPTAGVPLLPPGTTAVTIGAEGYAEWGQVGPAATLAVTGASAWKLYDAEGAPLGAGTGDVSGLAAPAGALLVVFGAPADGVDVEVA